MPVGHGRGASEEFSAARHFLVRVSCSQPPVPQVKAHVKCLAQGSADTQNNRYCIITLVRSTIVELQVWLTVEFG